MEVRDHGGALRQERDALLAQALNLITQGENVTPIGPPDSEDRAHRARNTDEPETEELDHHL